MKGRETFGTFVRVDRWFGVPRYQNRHHGFLAAAGSRAPELPGFLPADARCDRSRRAMQFGIADSLG
jgi:hypothetical protein